MKGMRNTVEGFDEANEDYIGLNFVIYDRCYIMNARWHL